ncbi:N-6 DNA methylase [Elizabethkingia anophelis]|uniref:N-6 DNA methylase n=1 Tax=Elizabethkingia anophelis TaxID=1117645 RepID=UPI0038923A56
MITKDNFKELLEVLGFSKSGNIYSKKIPDSDTYLKVDFQNEQLIYPEEKGLKINEKQTCNFSQKENFVVFECVHRLLEKGYKPEHIELEPRWKVGHGASGGRADIMIKDNSGKSLLIIECKTEGKEFDDAWKKTLINGGQLISYVKQAGSTQFVCLYTSNFNEEKVICKYNIVTLIDNEDLLKELINKSPLSYEKAKSLDVEDIYNVWKDTYEQDYATKGLFEADIPAYNIGKKKYTLTDLDKISGTDIQGKYHEFATILRQHNVSGRENAFDKLVNLFLCKIVDESNNSDDLKFYWKGIAYDDPFSLIDRLQKLYQIGMEKFLGEDVVYISSDQIEEAFDFFKNDKDATKDKIKEYFKELKFFNNNDFGFIDVHNEKLFKQNFKILLRIVQMLQDIRLKTDTDSASEENQFLGDMFEGFLDQGVKQSEGQFFTPMPIVKFILKSLPLEDIIENSEDIPKTIDYACGAGHFLNEYAKEIKDIIELKKDAKLSDYYENIYGVEKEYRLSKVAKVSAFMYGQDDINIVYADALSSGKAMDDKNIKDKTFSVLVANPPYSVKGFLETLTDIERKKFKLLETVGEKSYPNNNSIEAFFIERAKQLLKPGGVAGIVVPSSILTKGKSKSTSKSTNIYVATREILLKFFDIVAISEFGSGTFGKTGTNTVTLFLRRKRENPAPSDHFKNRVNAWFNFDTSKDGIFEDEHLLKLYCNHLEFNFDDYQSLLKGSPNETLLESEIFKEYRKEFDKWTEIKNLKARKTFKELSKDNQLEELNKRFLSYLIDNEKEKLYYFVLASLNSQQVLIVKSPSKSTEIKEFLGYEWSAAKGNEGIKYLGGIQLDSFEGEDEEEGNVALEEEDKRVLSNIFNLNNINTPLYDPTNRENSEKINFLINQNFQGKSFEIPIDLEKYIIKTSLVNLIDFARPDFNKGIATSPKRTIEVETIWDSKKIGDIDNLIVKKGTSITQKDVEEGEIPVVAGGISYAYFHNKFNREKNTISISASGANAGYVNFWRKPIFASDCTTINSPDEQFIYYVYNLLKGLQADVFSLARGAAQPHVYPDDIKEIKLPLPPPKIQMKIVNECEAIDKLVESAEANIQAELQKIEELIIDFSEKGYPLEKISDLADVNPPKTEIKETDENTLVSFIEMASVSEKGYIQHKEDRKLKDVKIGSYKYFKEGDIIIAKITPCMENGKCAIAQHLTNGIGFGSSEFHVFRVDEEKASNKFVFAFLNREIVRKEAERNMTGSSGHRRVPDAFYKSLLIPVPKDKKIQNQLLKKIDECRANIENAKDFLSNSTKNKENIIRSYLMGEKK